MRGRLLTIALLLAASGAGSAATPKEIDAAVQKGAAYLKQQYNGAKPEKLAGDDGIGPTALAGLALLEVGTRPDDATVRAIAAGVRDASFTENRTYHVTLCLLFLDRLGDPADAPLVQMLGVRLLAGQNAGGGWTYACVDPVPAADERVLRAALLVTELKAGGTKPPGTKPTDPATPPRPAAAGKLHAEVEKYAAKLVTDRERKHEDDNSNTQFGILGVWVARKHGVPSEVALERIEKRFLSTQTATGGWPYSGHNQGSPSMTCAGLLGLATAVGRREERALRAEQLRKPAPSEVVKKPADPPALPTNGGDPFFNPPKPALPEPAKVVARPKAGDGPPKVADPRDAAIQKGLTALAAALAGDPGPAGGKGKGGKNRVLTGGALGDRDFYFLWSLERVGVIFGLEKIGTVDWYAFGAAELVAAQHAGGGWGKGARGGVVDTSFALLFLSRSNLVRDLSAQVQGNSTKTELRAGAFPSGPNLAPAPVPKHPAAATSPAPLVISPMPLALVPVAPDIKVLAAGLTGATGADWDKALAQLRDEKGAPYTQALVLAVGRLEGERKKVAREALAERLTRMTAATLRVMAKETDAEVRRAAVLAMAMKDDRSHLPDIFAALGDEDETVVRAARAGLKSFSGEDFGPATNATPADRAAAMRAWAEWLKKQK